jgi:hypothetical protein
LNEFAPFAPVISLWLSQIEKAIQVKDREFGRVADQCWSFYDNANTFIDHVESEADAQAGLAYAAEIPQTKFFVQIQKFAEAVDIFGPSMYQKYPNRVCRSRKPDIPLDAFAILGGPEAAMAVQQQLFQADARDRAASALLQWFLNYTPRETGHSEETLLSVDEALIKGRGLSEHVLYRKPESDLILPASFHRSVDDLVIDPDATSLRTALWVAVRCCEPYYLVEREYGWPEGALRQYANAGESYAQQSGVDTSKAGRYLREGGNTKDLLVYWKVYSKCGLGNSVAEPTMLDPDRAALRTAFGGFGDYTFLVIAKGIPHPLNLPPDAWDLDVSQPAVMDYFKDHFRWPIPFYADGGDYYGGWPVTCLDLHPMPNRAWPRAHMKSALAEMQFINHCFSVLMGKMDWHCRTIMAYADSLNDEVKAQARKGGDILLPLKRSVHKSIAEAIQFVVPPPLNPDFWKILSEVMHLFEMRTGLTPLLYGQSGKQMRSASEAELRQEQTMVRPDHMMERVESCESQKARKEAFMARWFVKGQNIGAIFREAEAAPAPPQVDPMTGMEIPSGPVDPATGMPLLPPGMTGSGLLAGIWDALVAVPLDYADRSTIARVVGEFEYTLESGSIRKPNREREQANSDIALQTLFNPLLQTYMATGNPQQLNALLTDWAKARDLDPTNYLFPDFQQQMLMQQQMAAEQQAAGQQPQVAA